MLKIPLKKRSKKEITVMVTLLIVFFVVFAIAYADYRFGVVFMNIGLPAKLINPVVMIASLLSMAKMFYHIVAY